MRDYSYVLDAEAAGSARPPFRYAELFRRRPPYWTIRDGRNHQVGLANTRAGARLAVRALYATTGGGPG